MEEHSKQLFDLCVDEDNLDHPDLGPYERSLIKSERVYTLNKISSGVDLRFHKMCHWIRIRSWAASRVEQMLHQEVVQLRAELEARKKVKLSEESE